MLITSLFPVTALILSFLISLEIPRLALVRLVAPPLDGKKFKNTKRTFFFFFQLGSGLSPVIIVMLTAAEPEPLRSRTGTAGEAIDEGDVGRLGADE